MRYGKLADGSVSPCHSKDPAHCPYHTDHADMTPQQADAINEAVKAVNNSPKVLAKKPEMAKEVDNLISYEDASERYDKAIKIIQDAENCTRSDLSKEMKAPVFKTANASRGDVDEKELEWLRNNKARADLQASKVLLPSEEKTIMGNLNASIKADPNRTTVSPLQEDSLRMLTMNPAQSQDTMDKLVKNPWVANNASRFLIGSPHCTKQQEETLYKKNPGTALESQRLSAEHVNESLKSATSKKNMREAENAFRHPNADPDLAYKTFEKISTSKDYSRAERQELEFQMSNNPNPEFHKKIAALDSNKPRIKQLLITREWNDWHSGDGHSDEISKL